MTDRAFTTFPFNATGGSATRTMPDRLADVANVLEYGADNTGGVSCHTAFNTALSKNRKVYVPAGTYLFTEGVDLDSRGGNAAFVIEGCGLNTVLTASMDDFIFRKVVRSPGSVGMRVIRDLKINNTKSTLAAAITTITNAVWSSSITGGLLNGQPGVTVTLSAGHGYTVGTSRLMNIAGISPSGFNGLVGVYFDGASSFQYNLQSTPGSYSSGGSYAPRGGGVSTIGLYGGNVSSCDITGYYGAFSAVDTTMQYWGNTFHGTATNTGNGIVTGGNSLLSGNDITGFSTGILAAPSETGATSCSGLAIIGGRLEINSIGIDLSGASAVTVSGISFEGHGNDTIRLRGSGQIHIDGCVLHGETGGVSGSSVNGIHVTGSVNNIDVSNTYIYGDYSGSCIKFDSGLGTCQGQRFRNVGLSNTGSGTNSSLPAQTLCPQWDSCVNVDSGAFSSTYANRPNSGDALAGEVWQFTDSAVAAGSSTAISGGGANNVMARYAGSDTWYVYARAG